MLKSFCKQRPTILWNYASWIRPTKGAHTNESSSFRASIAVQCREHRVSTMDRDILRDTQTVYRHKYKNIVRLKRLKKC